MNSSVKRLTEAAILSAAFIIITMVALSTGLGYGLYLDFGVPIIFALIYFRCDLKYTFMCGISSVLLILFVLGNFAFHSNFSIFFYFEIQIYIIK